MVYHVFKDGTVKTNITGHVIKMTDAPALYEFLHNFKRKNKKTNERKLKKVTV